MLDLMIPKIDGFETLKQIRSFSAVPVIILSARVNDADKIRGLSLGADDYLPKPFNPDWTGSQDRGDKAPGGPGWCTNNLGASFPGEGNH